MPRIAAPPAVLLAVLVTLLATSLAAPLPAQPPAALRSEASAEPPDRPRLRDLGVSPGVLPPGPENAITDVAGVRVGHRTVVEGDSVRTGVTAILPHGGNLFQEKVPAAVWVANAFGKAAGFLQVQELGTIETPIVLTNTLSVGTAVEAVVGWTLERPGNEEVRSVNAVVGETNDGWLNDIRGGHVTAAHVREAIEAAWGGPVAEGSVGAGTGTRALGWKGGIGTASRRLPERLGGWTVGALVQTNFGGVLAIDGVPVGEALGRYPYREEIEAADGTGTSAVDGRSENRDSGEGEGEAGTEAGERGAAETGGSSDVGRPEASDDPPPPAGDGSVMIVLATDAPLSTRALERLASRAVLALGRVGSFMSHGSGDFVVAFSTAERRPYREEAPVRTVREATASALSPLFLATVEAVEEAIYNSLVAATTVTGRDGHTAEALPLDDLRRLLVRYGRLEESGEER